MKDKKGFTLIEVIAVIAVLGIIMVITIPNIDRLLGDSKEDTYKEQLRELYRATDMYMSDKAILLNIDETKIISVPELMAEGYITHIPKNSITKKVMHGIIEAKGTSNNNVYNYIEDDLANYVGVVNSGKTPSSIVIDGISTYENITPFKDIAEKVTADGNGEIREVDNKKALVINSQDIYNVSDNWLNHAFEKNKVYTIKLKTKVIDCETSNTAYELRIRFKYNDGTYSDYKSISNYSNTEYTAYEISSEINKTVENIEISSQADSPYKIAISINDFIITPPTAPSYNNEKKIISLGDNGQIEIKFVTEDNKVITKKLLLNNSLRSIMGTDVADELTIKADGTIQLTRKVEQKELNELNWALYDDSQSSNGMVAYQANAKINHIDSFDIMSNYFKYYKYTWVATSTQVGISANSGLGELQYVYIKVPLSEFPTAASFNVWVNEKYANGEPLTVQYQLDNSLVSNLDTISINLKEIKYIYVNSKLIPKITVNY